MCLSIKVADPSRVLEEGIHEGFEWVITHNNMGFRCGYVKLLPGHPWHSKQYDDIEASVHGGLTFSEADHVCGEGPDDSWWIGFDCAHSMDSADPSLPGSERMSMFRYGQLRTQDYVRSECHQLCEQAKKQCPPELIAMMDRAAHEKTLRKIMID